jgi:hypothetical protein
LYVYRLYGLLVASNEALPDLTPLGMGGIPDVVFHAGSLPSRLDTEQLRTTEAAYTSPYCDPSGEPFSRMWICPRDHLHYFRFIEGFDFAVDSTGETIWARWSEPTSLRDIAAFLLGRILAFVLHLRGDVCLHASAVAIDGKAVLFAGDPGMGKSSTAAAFVERGCAGLTDDLAVLRREPEGRMMVMPGPPRLCLCPDSVGFLYGQGFAQSLPRLHPDEEKRVVPLDPSIGKFHAGPSPLEAIYLFSPRSSDPATPRIEPVAGADSLIRLLYSGFMNLALDKEQTAREFQILGEIARTVRLRQLVPSNDARKLDRLCDLVLDDVRAASLSPAGRSC